MLRETIISWQNFPSSRLVVLSKTQRQSPPHATSAPVAESRHCRASCDVLLKHRDTENLSRSLLCCICIQLTFYAFKMHFTLSDQPLRKDVDPFSKYNFYRLAFRMPAMRIDIVVWQYPTSRLYGFYYDISENPHLFQLDLSLLSSHRFPYMDYYLTIL